MGFGLPAIKKKLSHNSLLAAYLRLCCQAARERWRGSRLALTPRAQVLNSKAVKLLAIWRRFADGAASLHKAFEMKRIFPALVLLGVLAALAPEPRPAFAGAPIPEA